jgi:hypothetical protein
MTDRAQKLMDAVYRERNTWADTEQKLVAAIIRQTMDYVKTMTAQKLDNLTVLDKRDMIAIANEVENLQ